MKALWWLIRAYGEILYRMNGGSCAGYYWALRACCNWCGYNWYGEKCGKVFNRVGRIKW